MKHLLVHSIVAFLLCGSTAAAQDLVTSAAAAAARLGAQRTRPEPANDDPYRLPGFIMLIGGGVLAIAGAADDTGVQCETSAGSFDCSTTKNKGLIFTGLGLAGVGSYFLLRQRGRSPSIEFGYDSVTVQQRLSF